MRWEDHGIGVNRLAMRATDEQAWERIQWPWIPFGKLRVCWKERVSEVIREKELGCTYVKARINLECIGRIGRASLKRQSPKNLSLQPPSPKSSSPKRRSLSWKFAIGHRFFLALLGSGPRVILLFEYSTTFLNGAINYFHISKYGAMDYFWNICCETIVELGSHPKVFE